jgi:hypothetical protein
MFYKKRYVSLKFMFSPFPVQEIPATIGSSETETALFVSLLEMTGPARAAHADAGSPLIDSKEAYAGTLPVPTR